MMKHLIEVVLIDNQREDLELYERRLTRFGLSFTGVETYQELLNHLEKSIPDIILIDLAMPVMSGIDVAKALRDLKISSILCFLTDQDIDRAIISSAYLYGVTEIFKKEETYIHEDKDFDDFIHTIKDLVINRS